MKLLENRFTEIGWVIAPEVETADGYYRDLQRSDVWWEVVLWEGFKIFEYMICKNINNRKNNEF